MRLFFLVVFLEAIERQRPLLASSCGWMVVKLDSLVGPLSKADGVGVSFFVFLACSHPVQFGFCFFFL